MIAVITTQQWYAVQCVDMRSRNLLSHVYGDKRLSLYSTHGHISESKLLYSAPYRIISVKKICHTFFGWKNVTAKIPLNGTK